MKKATTVQEAPAVTPREIGDDEQVQITASRKELAALWNAARALELMSRVDKNGTSDMQLIDFAVLLDATCDPAFNAISELQDRFRDQELRAAGQGEKLDRLEAELRAE